MIACRVISSLLAKKARHIASAHIYGQSERIVALNTKMRPEVRGSYAADVMSTMVSLASRAEVFHSKSGPCFGELCTVPAGDAVRSDIVSILPRAARACRKRGRTQPEHGFEGEMRERVTGRKW